MDKVKYIRVSSEEQNAGRQRQNIKIFSKIYEDKVSGAIQFNERKEAKKLLRDIDAGPVSQVHVSSIDRLGRNILDILTVIELFHTKSVSLFVGNIGMYSMIDNKINPAFKMIGSVLGNIAEMEREYLRERQKQGIEIAKAKGRYRGRLYVWYQDDRCQFLEKYKIVVKELVDNKQSLRRAARLGGCSLGTVQKIKRILQDNQS